MPTLMEKRDALIQDMRATADLAEKESRGLTEDEMQTLESKDAEVKDLNEQIQRASRAESIVKALGEAPDREEQDEKATSIGEHFVKSAAVEGLANLKAHRRSQVVDSGEYKADMTRTKAPGDVNLVSTVGEGWLQPQVDRNIVHQYNERPTVAGWLGSGQTDSTSIQYFVERPFDPTTGGDFGFVGENEKKPGLTFPGYDPKTETLSKIAGWTKISDEMAEDTPFLVSEINNRLMYQLAMMEEGALLRGTGTGAANNLLGLLNRSGIQKLDAATVGNNLDAIYHALTQVNTATGLQPDGMVMHPLDYQALRLVKDGNGQYLAGGPFMGQYGSGSAGLAAPIWGYTPIITTAVPQGTVLVGAARVASTVYRKGGIRVEASNYDGEDFTHNRFTILAEERLMLAVRQPAAFVNLTLAPAVPAAG